MKKQNECIDWLGIAVMLFGVYWCVISFIWAKAMEAL